MIKVDLLGLGHDGNALEEAVPMIHDNEGVQIDYAHLPPGDPKTYELIRRADTAGVFQIESRAQMASLPRNRPVTSTTWWCRWRSSAPARSPAT